MKQGSKNEGWAHNITSRNNRYYYKDGTSLCGKALEEKFFSYFDKESEGFAGAKDCKICIKKLKEIRSEEPLNYKKYNY